MRIEPLRLARVETDFAGKVFIGIILMKLINDGNGGTMDIILVTSRRIARRRRKEKNLSQY